MVAGRFFWGWGVGCLLSISTLNAKETYSVELKNYLPNLKEQKNVEVSPDEPILIHIHLEKDWKISLEAPSQLLLFEQSGLNTELVRKYEKTEIRFLNFKLPKLKNKHQYRLQATLYFCREGVASLCQRESRDFWIRADRKLPFKVKIDIYLK